MPFEPLQTDEKLESPTRREPDTDTVMLFGCTHFVFAAVITYGIGIVPFFLISNQHTASNLLTATGIGLVLSAVFGYFVGRRSFIVGASGFLGGSMAAATFLLLRVQQLLIAKGMRDLPQPEYPDSWAWILPIAWIVVSAIVALVGTLSNSQMHTGSTEASR